MCHNYNDYHYHHYHIGLLGRTVREHGADIHLGPILCDMHDCCQLQGESVPVWEVWRPVQHCVLPLPCNMRVLLQRLFCRVPQLQLKPGAASRIVPLQLSNGPLC